MQNSNNLEEKFVHNSEKVEQKLKQKITKLKVELAKWLPIFPSKINPRSGKQQSACCLKASPIDNKLY